MYTHNSTIKRLFPQSPSSFLSPCKPQFGQCCIYRHTNEAAGVKERYAPAFLSVSAPVQPLPDSQRRSVPTALLPSLWLLQAHGGMLASVLQCPAPCGAAPGQHLQACRLLGHGCGAHRSLECNCTLAECPLQVMWRWKTDLRFGTPQNGSILCLFIQLLNHVKTK